MYHIIEDFFEKYDVLGQGRELVVCWSGGKDSTALLLLLADFKRRNNIPLQALIVPYPKAMINYVGLQDTLQYWENQGISINVLEHNQPDPEHLLRSEICLKCKEIRREVLTTQYFDKCKLEDTVIATGHNSWDLAAYLIELIIRDIGSDSIFDREESYHRHLEIMNRFLPIYRDSNGPTIIRPLLTFGNTDIIRIIQDLNAPFPFPFIPCECPWLGHRPKRKFEKCFELMKLQFDTEKLIQYVNKVLKIPLLDEFSTLPFQIYLL